VIGLGRQGQRNGERVVRLPAQPQHRHVAATGEPSVVEDDFRGDLVLDHASRLPLVRIAGRTGVLAT
jgi:hypothetical protein